MRSVSYRTFQHENPNACVQAHGRLENVKASRNARGPTERTAGDPCRSNKLLASMDTETLDALRPHMKRAHLERGDVLLEMGAELTHVWFPEDCVVSLLIQMENGSSAQVAAIGREGAVGSDALLGCDRSLIRTTTQVPGYILYIEARNFLRVMEDRRKLRVIMWHGIAAVQAEIMQSAACYALHPARDRLARFLLMTQDRTGSPNICLTQELLAEMLGVQRTTVTGAALSLMSDGLILYRRGHITISDHAGLEGAACECYEMIGHLSEPDFHKTVHSENHRDEARSGTFYAYVSV